MALLKDRHSRLRSAIQFKKQHFTKFITKKSPKMGLNENKYYLNAEMYWITTITIHNNAMCLYKGDFHEISTLNESQWL